MESLILIQRDELATLITDCVTSCLKWHTEPTNPPQEKRNVGESSPITTKQLCEFLSITEPTAIRWRQKGKIPFFQIGSAIRYDKNEVMEALRVDKQKTR